MDGGLNSCSEYREKCRGQRNYVQRRVVFKAIRAFSLGSLSNCMAESPSLSGRSNLWSTISLSKIILYHCADMMLWSGPTRTL